MADKAIVGVLPFPRSRRDDQLVRRNLRIAIRQVERAELYLHAIESLNLEDKSLDRAVSDLERRVRALHDHLMQRRSATSYGPGAASA